MRGFFRKLTWFARRGRKEKELEEELAFHLEADKEDAERSGLSRDDARSVTVRRFGNVTRIKEDARSAWGWTLVPEIARDCRYALRVLGKNSASTGVAIVSLALAIGSTTAIYGTADWLLNRPPGGVIAPDELVTLRTADENHPELGELTFSFPQYEDLHEVQDAFVDIAAYGKIPGIVATDTWSDQVVFELVTGNFFPLLGLRPELGRLIDSDDDGIGRAPVAVLSHKFWLSRFRGDPRVVGEVIRFNGTPARVVGILPREFEGYSLDWNGPTSVWLPVRTAGDLGIGGLVTGNSTFFPIIGRLLPGTHIDAALDRAQSWVPQMREAPTAVQYVATTIMGSPSNDMRIGRRDVAQSFFGMLLAVCLLILLAACFNVANFLVGRAASRRAEIALRSALGATRSRLVRQLVVESLMIGVAAAALGAVVAVGLVRVLATLPYVYLSLPMTGRSLTTEAAIDWRLALVAMILGIASALAFGLLPALMASFRNPSTDLKAPTPQWTWCGARISVRQVLLGLQVALSVVLAVTSGLYARSFVEATAIDSGIVAPEEVFVARIVPVLGMSPEEGTAFYRAFFARLAEMPEVVSAGIGWNPPFFIGRTLVHRPGEADVGFQAAATAASPGFFETHGIRVLEGREFEDTTYDMDNGLIINAVLAERLWNRIDVVGESIVYGEEERVVTGVVAEERCNDMLGDPYPCAWRPFPMSTSSGYLRVRVQGDPTAFAPTLRAVVADVNPEVAVADDVALDDFIRSLTGAERAAAAASSSLAFLAILLVAIGCVSLFVSMVRDSIREIAVRMALGADNVRLTTRIVVQGGVLALAGILLGIGSAWIWSDHLAGQLYRTDPTDPATFLGAPILVFSIALIAVFSAARVATRIDPAECLRAE